MTFKPLMRDDFAEHQIRIVTQGGKLYVTCQCRSVATEESSWKQRYQPLAQTRTAEESFEVYRQHLAEVEAKKEQNNSDGDA